MTTGAASDAGAVRRRSILTVLCVAVVFLPVAAVTAQNPIEQLAYPAAVLPFVVLLVGGWTRWISQERLELWLLAFGTVLVTVLFWGLSREVSTIGDLVAVGTSFGARNSLMLIAVAFLLLTPSQALRYAGALLALWVLLSFVEAARIDEAAALVDEATAFVRAFLSTAVTVAVLWGLTRQAVTWASGHEAAREEAERDQLTGLANRRGLERQLVDLLESADAVCVAMVDIDHFKEVNDTHGHDVGDTTLSAVADALRLEVREGDVVARWGGEEFVVVLRGDDLDRAALAAERCRAAVAAREPRRADDEWFPSVTVSIGVAAARPGDDVETVIARADEQLYRAKEAGRDCVRTAAG